MSSVRTVSAGPRPHHSRLSVRFKDALFLGGLASVFIVGLAATVWDVENELQAPVQTGQALIVATQNHEGSAMGVMVVPTASGGATLAPDFSDDDAYWVRVILPNEPRPLSSRDRVYISPDVALGLAVGQTVPVTYYVGHYDHTVHIKNITEDGLKAAKAAGKQAKLDRETDEQRQEEQKRQKKDALIAQKKADAATRVAQAVIVEAHNYEGSAMGVMAVPTATGGIGLAPDFSDDDNYWVRVKLPQEHHLLKSSDNRIYVSRAVASGLAVGDTVPVEYHIDFDDQTVQIEHITDKGLEMAKNAGKQRKLGQEADEQRQQEHELSARRKADKDLIAQEKADALLHLAQAVIIETHHDEGSALDVTTVPTATGGIGLAPDFSDDDNYWVRVALLHEPRALEAEARIHVRRSVAQGLVVGDTVPVTYRINAADQTVHLEGITQEGLKIAEEAGERMKADEAAAQAPRRRLKM